jgi:hypothetical protein
MAPKPHDPAPEQNFLRKVLSVSGDGVLLHFHLACGHLLSQSKKDVATPHPTSMDCWACREEKSPTH